MQKRYRSTATSSRKPFSRNSVSVTYGSGASTTSVALAKTGLWTPAALISGVTSGNTLGGVALWLDASDNTTITIGTGVSEWRDKSGYGRNATQATGANQPSYIESAQNGLNVIRFDGTDDFMNYNGEFLGQRLYAVYAVVARRSNKSDNFYIAGSTSSTNQQFIAGWANNTTYRYAQYSNDIDATVTGYSSSVFEIWEMFLESGGRRLWRDGTQMNTNTTTTRLSANLGGYLGVFTTANPDVYYDGDIAEIVAFPYSIAAADRTRMQGYLAHKWGLTAALPAGHAHKTTAPTL